jgi:cobalt-precorrin 5A hydrolase
MKIAGICFTRAGMELAERIRVLLEQAPGDRDIRTEWYCKGRYVEESEGRGFSAVRESMQEWAGKRFRDCDGLIFIGATGIAVRAVAPWVRDKRQDPAVLVLDEKGKFCIPLLSGHIGGANELAEWMSGRLGAIPVLTTATDVNSRFAVDVYAKKNDLVISNMTYAKEVSAALLSGEQVGIYTSFPVHGALPEGLVWADGAWLDKKRKEEGGAGLSLGIYISPSYHSAYFDHTLWLIPRCLTLGIGCRKGVSARQIEKLVDEAMRSFSLYPEAIAQVATIDLKKEEPGLLEFCRSRELPLVTYSAAELKAVPGRFSSSGFVAEITGVDNVCERSAVLAGDGKLIIRKMSGDGVTCAVALQNRSVEF